MKKLFISLITFIFFYIVVMYYIYDSEKGIKYLFPENYKGWVCITYASKNSPKLKEENGFLVIKIPKNGIVKTSSFPKSYSEEGYFIPTYDEHYFYSENKEYKDENIGFGGGFTSHKKELTEFTSYFWITDKENLKKDYLEYVKNRDISKLPKCGSFIKKTL